MQSLHLETFRNKLQKPGPSTMDSKLPIKLSFSSLLLKSHTSPSQNLFVPKLPDTAHYCTPHKFLLKLHIWRQSSTTGNPQKMTPTCVKAINPFPRTFEKACCWRRWRGTHILIGRRRYLRRHSIHHHIEILWDIITGVFCRGRGCCGLGVKDE